MEKKTKAGPVAKAPKDTSTSTCRPQSNQVLGDEISHPHLRDIVSIRNVSAKNCLGKKTLTNSFQAKKNPGRSVPRRIVQLVYFGGVEHCATKLRCSYMATLSLYRKPKNENLPDRCFEKTYPSVSANDTTVYGVVPLQNRVLRHSAAQQKCTE